MTRPLLWLAALGVLASGAQAADADAGKNVFDRYCAECHAAGVGHPGAQMLGWLKGERQALLEQRTDLTAVYVSLVVRQGLLEMPPYRPSEITDASLADLGAYLTRHNPAKAGRN